MTSPLDTLEPRAGLGLIVAVGERGAIGRDGGLPWHAPEDLAHFKRVTLGHHVIVGSATWTSIGRPLPGRQLVVVSRRRIAVPDGVVVAGDPAAAAEIALASDPAPLVAGGAQIYEAFREQVVRALVTDVAVAVDDADAFFPPLEPEIWTQTCSWPGDDPRLTFRVFDRRGSEH